MTQSKKRIGKLLFNTLLAALGGTVVVVVITAIAGVAIKNNYAAIIEEELKVSCAHLRDELDRLYEGDYSVDASGTLIKGEAALDGGEEVLDTLKRSTGVEYAIYFGKTAMLTTLFIEGTNSRMAGAQADDAVYNTVVGQGQSYYADGVVVNGEPFSVYYAPIERVDGARVGMIFSGRRSFEVKEKVRSTVLSMLGIGIGLVFVLVAVVFPLALKVSRRISDMGDLLGSTSRMSGELNSSSKGLFASAGQVQAVSDQVSRAVSEVSRGSISQAKNAKDAVQSSDSLGKDIDDLSESMGKLGKSAGELKAACDKAATLVDGLGEKDGEVDERVRDILDSARSIGESAASFAQVSATVAEVAEEANLLSLDASIEASRAGAAGKGFAVIAGEIRKLADKYRETAAKLGGISGSLGKDTDAQEKLRSGLDTITEARDRQLSAVRLAIQDMRDRVSGVGESAQLISEGMDGLNEARTRLAGIIKDLYDLARANAQSTEQTNASMQELNATFSGLSQSAAQLQELSDNLQETISVIQG